MQGSSSTIEPGTAFGRYRVERLLGTGGMGEVYAAYDGVLRRRVALKVLRAGQERASARLLREARAAAGLGHAGAVAIFDIGEVRGTPFIAMELVVGTSLRAHVGDATPVGVKLRWLAGVARVLEAAHAHGLVHRDVKPENVMVGADGGVKVLDFGVAKPVDDRPEPPAAEEGAPPSFRTAEGSVSGTPRYMSPEQRAGETLDGRADQFAWGVTAFELLTGAHPHTASIGERLGSTTAEVLPAEVAAAVKRALAQRPSDRFPSMGDVAAILEPHATPAAATGSAPALPTPSEQPTAQTLPDEPPESPADPGAHLRRERRTRRRRLAAIAAVAVSTAGLVALALGPLRLPSKPVASPSATSPSPKAISAPRRIVVLPLDAGGGEPDTEFLASGGTDALVDELSREPALRVIARASSRRYAETKTPLPQIGRELDVGTAVTGSLRIAKGEARLSVEIVDVGTQAAAWSRTYTSTLDGLSPAFRRAAREVAEALGAPPHERVPAVPVSPAAYQAFLRGRYFWEKRSGESTKAAIRYFDEALAIDPNYAPAHLGLAEAYGLLPYVVPMPYDEAEKRARASLDRALALDPGSSRAHAVRGTQLCNFDWRWSDAEVDYRRALELDDGNAEAYQWYSQLLMVQRRFGDAVREVTRALALEPTSVSINKGYGQVLVFAKRYAEAETQLKKTIEMDPNQSFVHMYLGIAYVEMGRVDEAIAEFRKESVYANPEAHADELATDIYAYHHAGRDVEVKKRLAQFEADPSARAQPALLAWTYATVGRKEDMLAALDRAIATRAPGAWYAAIHPAFDPYREDARFIAQLAKMGLSAPHE